MNRVDLIRYLIRNAIYKINYGNIAIILKNYERVKIFNKDFLAELSGIPEWIRPKPDRLNIRRIEFPTMNISIVDGSMALHGLNISHAFIANDLDINDEHKSLLYLLPTISAGGDIPEKFDDV